MINMDQRKKIVFHFVLNIAVVLSSLGVLLIYFGDGSWKHLLSLFFQSDFYINYQSGFIRRGLDGEIIFQLSQYFTINPFEIQIFYSVFGLFAFSVILAFFILGKKIPYYILFSPALLITSAYTSEIRKDHLLMLLYFVMIFTLTKKKWTKIPYFTLANLFLIFGILLHELFFFFSFFPLVILYILKDNYVFDVKKLALSIMYLLPSIALFLVVCFLFQGNERNASVMIDSWKSLNPQLFIKYNVGLFDGTQYLWRKPYSALQFSGIFFCFAVSFLFIIWAVCNHLKNEGLKKVFIILLILQYLVIFVISLFAIDFSRWMFMGNLSTIIFIYSLDKNLEIPLPDFTHRLDTLTLFFQKYYYVPFILYFIVGMPIVGWQSIGQYANTTPLKLIFFFFERVGSIDYQSM